MKKEVMQKWVDALRSGEYQQIDGRLRSYEPDESGQYSYCCLGVLCDLHRKEHNPDGADGRYAWGTGVGQTCRETTTYAAHPDTLPAPVREWAGIRSSNPGVLADPHGDGQDLHELVALNDECSYEFGQLAELIERQWESI